DVRPLLRAAEHGDALLVDRETREDVDGQVQALAGREAAHGGGPDDHGGEVGSLVPEQDRLAHPLVLVVVGERDERMVLGDVWSIAHPVDARGRGVDESPDAGPPRDAHEWLEARVVDGGAGTGR